MSPFQMFGDEPAIHWHKRFTEGSTSQLSAIDCCCSVLEAGGPVSQACNTSASNNSTLKKSQDRDMWTEVLGLRVMIHGRGEVVSCEKQEPKPPKIFPCLAQSHLFCTSLFCKRARRNKSSTDFKRESRLQHSGRNSLVCHSNGTKGNWLDTCRYQLMCFFPFVDCSNFNNNNPPNFPKKRSRRLPRAKLHNRRFASQARRTRALKGKSLISSRRVSLKNVFA